MQRILLLLVFCLCSPILLAQNHFLVWQDFASDTRILIDSKGNELATIEGNLLPAFSKSPMNCFVQDIAILRMKEGDVETYYLLDTLGKLSDPIPHHVFHYREGYAMIRHRESNLYGVIDRSGKVVVEPQYKSMNPFSEGLAAVTKDGKRGYIDSQGNVVIPFLYLVASDFKDGLAMVKLEDGISFIDKSGQMLFEPVRSFRGTYTDTEFHNDRCKMSVRDQGVGYIDRSGKFAIPLQFKSGSSFSDGLAVASMGNGEYEFIDTNGNIAIDKSFHSINSFKHGLARVQDLETQKYGLINTKGEYIIPPNFEANIVQASSDRIIVRKAVEDFDKAKSVGDRNRTAGMKPFIYDGQGKLLRELPVCCSVEMLNDDLICIQYADSPANNYEIIDLEGNVRYRPYLKNIRFKSLDEAAQYPIDSVQHLSLSGLPFSSIFYKEETPLDDRLFAYKALVSLDMDDFNFATLPAEIAQFHKLEKLSLEGSGLSKLPEEICQLTQLKELNLKSNYKLKNLPDCFVENLQQLEHLNVKRCDFDSDTFYELKTKLENAKVIIK